MLQDEDAGRPITNLVSKLQHEDLGVDCRSVLKTLVFMEAEVSTLAVRLNLTVLTGNTGEVDAIAFTFKIISGETR